MAYPTGLEETRAGTISAHPGYVCRSGENGRGIAGGTVGIFKRVAADASETLTTAVSVSLANKSPDRLMHKVFHFTGRID